MDLDQELIDALVRDPSEGLNVEVKRWLDLSTPEGQAKIVKGCLGLYNRNGGFFVVGFDDQSMQPDLGHEPTDVRRAFHIDDVQGLVSRHAQDLFEVAVGFSQRGGIEYPVIVVPPGVQVPVAAKKPLADGGGKMLIASGDVYVRTLSANGTPSTSKARPQDWRDILEICFDNRDASIGRFLRRQLTGIDRNALAEALLQIGFMANLEPVARARSLRDEVIELLADGKERFKRTLASPDVGPEVASYVGKLTWDAALVMQPLLADQTANQEFLSKVLGSNPRYTGWPVWLDSRSFADHTLRPYRVEDAWEALIATDGAGPAT